MTSKEILQVLKESHGGDSNWFEVNCYNAGAETGIQSFQIVWGGRKNPADIKEMSTTIENMGGEVFGTITNTGIQKCILSNFIGTCDE